MYKNNPKISLIAGTLLGNVMEWYDFIVYIYLSSYMTKQFFQNQSPFMAKILILAIFMSGYLTRPIGAMISGYIGDKFGRNVALTQSIFLITISTVCIGLLPSYTQIGLFAPLLLILLRLIQGLAVSGEQTGAAVYLSEIFGKNKNGFMGAFVLSSSYSGILMGSLVCLLVTMMLPETAMNQYGWRIPFLLSIPLGIISIKIRLNSVESLEFQNAKLAGLTKGNPIKIVFQSYRSQVLLLIFLGMALAVPLYIMIYLHDYISDLPGFSKEKGMLFTTIGLLFVSVLLPFVGKLADKIGVDKTMILGLFFSSLLGYPLFLGLSSGIPYLILLSQISIGLSVSFIGASIFGIILRNFPTNVKYTGVSFIFNCSMALFGSTVPIICVCLKEYFNTPASPGFYLSLSGLVGLFSLYFLNHMHSIKNEVRVTADEFSARRQANEAKGAHT